MAINFALRPSFINSAYKKRNSAPVLLERLNLELMNKNMNDVTEAIIAKNQIEVEKAKMKAKEIRKFSPDITGVWAVDIPEITEALDAVYAQANSDLDRYGRLSADTKMLEAELVLKVEASKQQKEQFDGAVTAFEEAEAGVYDADYYDQNLVSFKDAPISEREQYLNLLEKYQPSLFELIEIPEDIGSQSFTLATGSKARVSEEIRTTTFDDMYIFVGNAVYGDDYLRQRMVEDFEAYWATLTPSQRQDVMVNAKQNPMMMEESEGNVVEYTYWDDDDQNMQIFDMALRHAIDNQFSNYIGEEVDRSVTAGYGVSRSSANERDAEGMGSMLAQWLYNNVYDVSSYGPGETYKGAGYFGEKGLGTINLTPQERVDIVANASNLDGTQQETLGTFLSMGEGQSFQTSTEEITNELIGFEVIDGNVVMITTRDVFDEALGIGPGYTIALPAGATDADIGSYIMAGLRNMGAGAVKGFQDELINLGAATRDNLNTIIVK